MSYNFSYTGNPPSNNNTDSLGYRYYVNTTGTAGNSTNGGTWRSWRIPETSFNNGTYIVNASLMTPISSSGNRAFIYIIQNRTSTATSYGGIIDPPSFSSFNQGISTFNDSFTGTVSGGALNGTPLYTILAGSKSGPDGTFGTSLSVTSVFTFIQSPYGGTASDNNTIAAICWFDSGAATGTAYITVTRIA